MKKIAYIFDIDGTLALRGERSPFDWAKVGFDKPHQPVIDLLMAIKSWRPEIEIIICTGRDEVCREDTVLWLNQNIECYYSKLYMRPFNNLEKDSVIKKRMLDEIQKEYNVLGVFDDRNQVVQMWRENNIPCFQVADGNF
jgi:hypothetical protein